MLSAPVPRNYVSFYKASFQKFKKDRTDLKNSLETALFKYMYVQ